PSRTPEELLVLVALKRQADVRVQVALVIPVERPLSQSARTTKLARNQMKVAASRRPFATLESVLNVNVTRTVLTNTSARWMHVSQAAVSAVMTIVYVLPSAVPVRAPPAGKMAVHPAKRSEKSIC